MRHDPHGHGPVDDPNFVNDKPYETRDVVLSTVLKSIFVLFAFVGATSVLTWGIFRIMVPVHDERTSAFPLATVPLYPPSPQLQANPELDISRFRKDESDALTDYGRDSKTGELHIPVDRALDLVAQEGLPTRPDPGKLNPQEPNEPSHTEGEAPPGAPTMLRPRRTMPGQIAPPGDSTTGMGAAPITTRSASPGTEKIFSGDTSRPAPPNGGQPASSASSAGDATGSSQPTAPEHRPVENNGQH